MKIRVNVKKSYIAKGLCEDVDKCMVALAIKAALRKIDPITKTDGFYTSVGEKEIDFRLFERYYSIPIIPRVQKLIERFDKHDRKNIKPFSFEINLNKP